MTAEAAEILQEIRDQLERIASKWKNCRQAAAYRGVCSVSKIDRAAAAGIIKPERGTGVPLFDREDLDAWVKGKNHKRNATMPVAPMN